MNKVQKNTVLVICLLVCISLIGCAKLIDTKNEVVNVTIVDEHHRAAYVTFMPTGKSLIPIHHSATYAITVEYNRVQYTIYGKDTYEKYHSMVGEVVSAILEVRIYDDGTVKYDINTIGSEEG